MSLDELLAAIEQTRPAVTIAESEWIFPTVESLHVVAITLVVGTIMMVDLRLMSLASRHRDARQLASEILPLTWLAFAVALVTGMLMFISKATTYGHSLLFIWKLGLIGLAGVNMVVFHLLVDRRGSTAPLGHVAKLSGFASLGLWAGVVACGRWIGFTT